MNDATTTSDTTATDNSAGTGKHRKRLQGAPVFDRVQREVLKLRRLIEDYRVRREPDSEDEVTKDVFDALNGPPRLSDVTRRVPLRSFDRVGGSATRLPAPLAARLWANGGCG